MGRIVGLLVHDSTWRSGPGHHLPPPGTHRLKWVRGGGALTGASAPRSLLISHTPQACVQGDQKSSLPLLRIHLTATPSCCPSACFH